jgi:predicted acylesterase/phospholipase RssA
MQSVSSSSGGSLAKRGTDKSPNLTGKQRHRFVCAVSAENRDLTVEFTSYTRDLESNSELMDNVKIWEACRATSAATTFFEPMKIGRYGQVFLDGATSANNPVQKLWLEAGEVWGGSLETKVQCLVSIGTGKGDVARFGNDAIAVGKTLMAIATETERTGNDFRRGHRDLDDRNAYYRFNVEKGLENVGLEDAKSRTEIATMTQAYMTQGETLKALRQFQKDMTATNGL